MSEQLTQITPRMASIELRPAEHVRVHPRQWEAQVESTRRELLKDGVADAEEIVAEAFRSMRFVDEGGAALLHDGTTWLRWDGASWNAAPTPDGMLRPTPFLMEMVCAPEPVGGLGWDPDDLPADDADVDDIPDPYLPTNLVPAGGLPAWDLPDPTRPPTATLDPGLDVMVLEWREDGWVQIRCANDWMAWVDGELLEPL